MSRTAPVQEIGTSGLHRRTSLLWLQSRSYRPSSLRITTNTRFTASFFFPSLSLSLSLAIALHTCNAAMLHCSGAQKHRGLRACSAFPLRDPRCTQPARTCMLSPSGRFTMGGGVRVRVIFRRESVVPKPARYHKPVMICAGQCKSP